MNTSNVLLWVLGILAVYLSFRLLKFKLEKKGYHTG